MVNKEMIEVFKAESIIQREALLALLADNEIATISPPRDLSRKIADDTVDLSYEGYSAIFDGFAIYVSADQKDRALKLIQDYLTQIQATHRREAEPPSVTYHLDRFRSCAMFGLIIPFVFTIGGAYHLIKAHEKGEPLRGFGFYSSLLLYLVGILLSITVAVIALT